MRILSNHSKLRKEKRISKEIFKMKGFVNFPFGLAAL